MWLNGPREEEPLGSDSGCQRVLAGLANQAAYHPKRYASHTKDGMILPPPSPQGLHVHLMPAFLS